MTDAHSRMDERLKAIKEAGERETGMKAEYVMRHGEKRSRVEVEAEYRRKSRWLDRHRKKFPGW